jgi:hypothetical protein
MWKRSVESRAEKKVFESVAPDCPTAKKNRLNSP